MSYKIRVSFDIDGTLMSNREVQKVCEQLSKNKDIQLWIHTRRYGLNDNESRPVYDLAAAFGISSSCVQFTNREMKNYYLIRNKIDIHLDDDLAECDIPPGSVARTICTSVFDWKKRLWGTIDRLLEERSSSNNDNGLEWRVHAHEFFQRVVELRGGAVLHSPANIFQNILIQVGRRATELNDKELNQLMMRLAIYEVADPNAEGFDGDYVNKYLET